MEMNISTRINITGAMMAATEAPSTIIVHDLILANWHKNYGRGAWNIVRFIEHGRIALSNLEFDSISFLKKQSMTWMDRFCREFPLDVARK